MLGMEKVGTWVMWKAHTTVVGGLRMARVKRRANSRRRGATMTPLISLPSLRFRPLAYLGVSRERI